VDVRAFCSRSLSAARLAGFIAGAITDCGFVAVGPISSAGWSVGLRSSARIKFNCCFDFIDDVGDESETALSISAVLLGIASGSESSFLLSFVIKVFSRVLHASLMVQCPH
jgi:hypothetical protein